MTKSELIAKVNAQAQEYGLREMEVIIDTIFDSMAQALSRNEKVELRGFGSFKIKERSPRIGRNPRTGSQVEIKKRRALLFKPAKELKALINQ